MALVESNGRDLDPNSLFYREIVSVRLSEHCHA